MPRKKGSKNKPKLEALPVCSENFFKLQSIRAEYVNRMSELQAEIQRVDAALLPFANWMEAEAKRLRQTAKT